MKAALFVSLLMLSFTSIANTPQESIVCSDADFGAGHLRLIIPDMRGFFSPRDQKPLIAADFWIRGEKFKGLLEGPEFMPEWGNNAGTYTSSPSTLDFSMCSWQKCPVRKIKLMARTPDQVTAVGTLKFVLQTEKNKKETFNAKINCEIQ
jgi:hypothetical protein